MATEEKILTIGQKKDEFPELTRRREDRKNATGNVALIVKMHASVEGLSHQSVYVQKAGDNQYVFCTRLHDGTGTSYGDHSVTLTKDEALEAKRLALTPYAIEE